MTEALRSFLLDGRDYNWLVELSLCAAAWVVLRFSIGGIPVAEIPESNQSDHDPDDHRLPDGKHGGSGGKTVI